MTGSAPQRYDPIAVSSEATVVAQYDAPSTNGTKYQSEAELELEFIQLLEAQAYEYLPLNSEADLITNLRAQLERLNGMCFTEREWGRFFETSISSANESIADKAMRIQEDHIQLLERDDGSTMNVRLIDKRNVHNNRLQVINQYETPAGGHSGGTYATRYDVTILVNGLPLVHVELKRRGVDIREAFNQIDRYQRHSFWAGTGLYDYVQLFVISNGTHTKYYSNTTRRQHIEGRRGDKRVRSTSNSYEFTSWWADAKNRPIQDLTAFARTFFAKHTLLNVLTRYCVLTADKLLLVMRPYQIAATERIMQRIDASTNSRDLGNKRAGGYVWHTTGSGKTLTSFKAAQLAAKLPHIDKVLFVVDRKDLDYQTMREYDRFQRGAASSNTSTAVLKRQLEDPAASIIITTIQKLANFVKTNRDHPVYKQHVVLIFDECHRSQFGEMHSLITKAFKRYNLFGFTGTPIFAVNSQTGGNPRLRTTEQAFGDRLHTYTIVDAITDRNVLPFRIDYINTIAAGTFDDERVPAIDREKALLAPERIEKIVQYALKNYDRKTRRSEKYTLGDRRLHGFNALFATASIDAARHYYTEFKRQQEHLTRDARLKVATIYSYAPNEYVEEGAIDEEGFDTDALSGDARTFLHDAISDYNSMFGTSFDTSAERFENYYKDLSRRLRNREVDLVIVVNMFLTGFDATTLNTLFVDKNLRQHGLIQAYSRTNRILNRVKTYGNIVSFRNLDQATNDAIALFGNKDARGIVLLKPYIEYYSEYAKKCEELKRRFPLGQPIIGEQAEKEFVNLYSSILRLVNILVSFDEFVGCEQLSPREEQDYRSVYLEIHANRRPSGGEAENINDDLVFEIELIKQVEINVDYILMLIEKHRRKHGDGKDKELLAEVMQGVDASPTLRSKRDLIKEFVQTVSLTGEVADEWRGYIKEKKKQELAQIIEEERLEPEAARAFIAKAFSDGAVATTGTALTRVLPSVSRFAQHGGYAETRERVLGRLEAFFTRFFGLAA